MSFDRDKLARMIRAHGPVCRVAVARVRGSAPREAGTAMLVWKDGQHGTIGGGTLEHEASQTARRMLAEGPAHALAVKPLGPALGQCCGGAVTLAWEVFVTAQLPDQGGVDGFFIRPVAPDAPSVVPQGLARLAHRPDAEDTWLADGWLAEPLARPGAPVWIYGGGHVGRAVAAVLAPLPEFGVTLIDTETDRLPDPVPEGVTPLAATDPVRVAAHAPPGAHHLIMTFSHEMDLGLCHRLLTLPVASIGVIGSRTKWARFRKRLAELDHDPEEIARIVCPIGDPDLGKHPQAIAIGVAQALIGASRNRKGKSTS